MICVPATLTGMIVAAVVSMFVGKDLADDPEYQARLASGAIPAPTPSAVRPALKPAARLSAFIFLAGVALVVLFGFFPALRQLSGATEPLGIPIVIELVMLAVAAVMVVATKIAVDDVPKSSTADAGLVAVIGIFGLAWLGDNFMAANQGVIVPAISAMTEAAPWTFALGPFGASVLLYSQAATTRALMPLGVALGIPPQFLSGAFPSVNGYFFIPTYGSLIAAIDFDRSGTTKIGKYIVNHSFMIPGLVATFVAVLVGLVLAKLIL
jgi:anaerobic C4-dicarboxylate transporter DcuA